MPKYSFTTEGTCSVQIVFELEDDVVKDVTFVGGCPGNLIGLSQLIRGQKIDDLIDRLKGIQCRNGTSYPDQFTRALEAVRQEKISRIG